jgi:hypothetical protein
MRIGTKGPKAPSFALNLLLFLDLLVKETEQSKPDKKVELFSVKTQVALLFKRTRKACVEGNQSLSEIRGVVSLLTHGARPCLNFDGFRKVSSIPTQGEALSVLLHCSCDSSRKG